MSSRLIMVGLPDVALHVIAPEDLIKSQPLALPLVPATLVISKLYLALVLNVKAPVDKVAVVLAEPPGLTVPVKDTAPAALPLPANTPVAATFTELVDAVLPLTYSMPALI